MLRQSIILLVFVTGFLFPAGGSASDPTRPPIAKKVLKPIVKNKVPTRPKPQVKSKGWVLSSTLVGPDRRTAVINNQVLSVGEKIKGFQVLEIQSGKVKLLAKGKMIVLEISKKDVKTTSRRNSHKPFRTNGK